jgi:pilus assembly protein Flp/PilA
MRRLLARFVQDQSGHSAIEYALIASGIAMAILAAINGLGTAISSTFDRASTALQ